MKPINFSQINLQRCDAQDGFNLGKEKPAYFALAMTEELGEICGILKKVNRGFNIREKKKLLKKLPEKEEAYTDLELTNIWYKKMGDAMVEEMADLYMYFDLFKSKMGVDLRTALIKKFNLVTKEMEFPEQYLIDDSTNFNL
jgi:uncharacterized protein YjgD (DUF1641 family)